jgi:hypothetical protein
MTMPATREKGQIVIEKPIREALGTLKGILRFRGATPPGLRG